MRQLTDVALLVGVVAGGVWIWQTYSGHPFDIPSFTLPDTGLGGIVRSFGNGICRGFGGC
ncbi:MAG: hypothetical protein VXW43_07450 [Pseudomonadota bacterium]|nr:hypothetical protein [Pseudomonadota bacterium]